MSPFYFFQSRRRRLKRQKWRKRLRRALFPFLLSLPPTVWGNVNDFALIEGVRIQPPAAAVLSPGTSQPNHPSPIHPLPPLELTAGRVLLQRYGCTTCHQFGKSTPAPTPGPALDAIAHKVSPTWLAAWLEDPFTYLPASRMPRVVLTPTERREIAAFLLGLSPGWRLPSRPDLPPDPYRGSDLFDALRCQQCHRVGGEGGLRGPALDRLGTKTSRRWLYAFLKAPHIAQPGTPSHSFHLVDQDALDLCEFLVRRAPSGAELPDDFTFSEQDTILAHRGLRIAIERGCFQCHAVRSLRGPSLPMPAAASTADSWLDHHRATGETILQFHFLPTARLAMHRALQDTTSIPNPVALPSDFWKLPIPPQGSTPEAYSPENRDLAPEACASCHVRQWEEWRNSRHARSLSPGLLGQLVDEENPGFIQHCLTCHAPLSEQYRTVTDGDFTPDHGITCAGCHVRAHRYFGPAKPDRRLTASRFTGGQHGDAVRTPAFRQSEFCAPCHQSDLAGLAFDGKLLQNTHGEWAASPHSAREETCQSCHMPDGQHFMTGIHDQVTVSRALDLEIDWKLSPETRHLRATVRIHNRGAGHHVPTYVTPAIFVKVALGDERGGVIDGTLQTRIVQRRIQLFENRELFDTRIPAGGAWLFEFASQLPAHAQLLTVVVEVDPDHFYRSFFEQYPSDSVQSASLIQQAHAQILDSPYILFVRTITLE